MREIGKCRRWLTIAEAAAYLGINLKTGYRWAAQGTLPAARIGGVIRIDLLKLDGFLEGQLKEGKG
jgi:excisionase family DNA binding protein